MFYSDANVKQVDVPSMSGNFGILANHVPMLAVLQAGVLNVFESEAVSKKYFGEAPFLGDSHGKMHRNVLKTDLCFAVSGGTVTVNDDSTVQILAEEAVPVENLDRQVRQTAPRLYNKWKISSLRLRWVFH